MVGPPSNDHSWCTRWQFWCSQSTATDTPDIDDSCRHSTHPNTSMLVHHNDSQHKLGNLIDIQRMFGTAHCRVYKSAL